MSVLLRGGLQPWVHGVLASQRLTTCYSTGESEITVMRCLRCLLAPETTHTDTDAGVVPWL